MKSLELERETSKVIRAIMTRNSQIGSDIITHLKTQLTPRCLAGVMLVSIERLLEFDAEAVVWAIENLIPTDVMQEIQSIFSINIYKHLIAQGCVPGKDLSVDANGKLLIMPRVKKVA